MRPEDELSAMILDPEPGLWSEDQAWDVFRHILDRNAPLPGLSRHLEPFREIFASVYAKIAQEHTLFKARYFRTEQGKPLVNPLNIEHFTRLLHPFTRRLFLEKAPTTLLDCLFAVMKAYCSLNIFYRTEEIDLFLPQHALECVDIQRFPLPQL
jgi:hypothetical protein